MASRAESCIIMPALERWDTSPVTCCVSHTTGRCISEMFSVEQIVHLQYLCKLTCTVENMSPSFVNKIPCQQRCVKEQYTEWWKQWITGSVLDKNKIQKLVFLGYALLILRGNVNKESNGYWCYKNPHTVREVSIISSWSAVSASKIIGPMFFLKKLFLTIMLNGIQAPLKGINRRWKNIEKSTLFARIWLFWGEFVNTSRWKFHHVLRSMLRRCKAWLWAEGWHFEILPWNKVSWTAG